MHKKTVNKFCSFFFAIVFACAAPNFAASIRDFNQLASESAAKTFYDLARQTAAGEQFNKTKTEQALIFLKAAAKLDNDPEYLSPLVDLLSRLGDTNQTVLVERLLAQYLKMPRDQVVINNTVLYLLNNAQSREQREKIVDDLYRKFRNKDKILDSTLLTMQGLLRQEVADPNSFVFFMNAVSADKYNSFAFTKLLELAPDRIDVLTMLEHLRLEFVRNPLDLQSALNLADYLRNLQLYTSASDAYRYCDRLYNYLYPAAPLPAEIYLPWAISDLNVPARLHNCIDLALKTRSSGQFDLVLDSIAAAAALQLGDQRQANLLLDQAQQKAKEFYKTDKNADSAKRLAWFYCFAAPDPNQAAQYAIAAYSIEPNSPMSAALLAYCLIDQKQNDKAKQLAQKFSNDQFAQISLSKIAIAAGSLNTVVENLNNAIAKDPAGLEGRYAKKLLAGLGQSYAAPINSQLLLMALQDIIKRPLVPEFAPPDKIISFELNTRGTKFSYDKDFAASLSITNISQEPLIISDGALFTGSLRVDAKLAGPVTEEIPNFVNLKFQPPKPIEPGQSFYISLNLFTGRLQQLLLAMPQANFTIEFTVYLDPVIVDGQVANKLADIKPVNRTITRPAENITSQQLQYLSSTITKNKDEPKIIAARLFAGLLAEQALLQTGDITYPAFSAENLVPFLQSGLLKNLSDTSWEVKTQTIAAINLLGLDSVFTPLVSDNLNDTHWPVRLAAVYLLMQQNPNFHKIIEQVSTLDPDALVRQLALTFRSN